MNWDKVVQNCTDLAQKTVARAQKHGAQATEVVVRDAMEMTARVRMGQPEYVEEAGSRALGLRVFVDHRCATTSTSDMRPEALEDLVEETVHLARLAEPDEFHSLPDPELFAKNLPALDLFDPQIDRVDAAEALRRAERGEKAALGHDKRITNSEGATFSRTEGASAFANSAGFAKGYAGSYASFYVQPIADDEGGKKRNGYYWTAKRYLAELEDPEYVGKRAAERTLEQLGSRKVKTSEVPVVFDSEAGRAIVGMLFSVANGSSFYRKSTYLLERENTPVASKYVTIVDDPLIPRGPGSRPYDGDGLATRKNVLVQDGVLKTILCDVYTARKLGRAPTGSAGRGVGGSPGPTTSNLIMQAGEYSKEQILKDTGTGLYVTSMMGFGFNPVTGDFSRGAAGFWIENGEITFPVSEITISANFNDLLLRIDRVGSDLDWRSSTVCPTFRVSSMTLAGLS
jgi:PmbA protein